MNINSYLRQKYIPLKPECLGYKSNSVSPIQPIITPTYASPPTTSVSASTSASASADIYVATPYYPGDPVSEPPKGGVYVATPYYPGDPVSEPPKGGVYVATSVYYYKPA